MRYFVGFIVTIFLIILLIVMLVGGGGGDKKAALPKNGKSFFSYANTDAEVSVVADSAINYDGTHKQVKITVSKTAVTYSQINGYNGQVSKAQSFPNNEAAYDNFLHALYHTGFTAGDTTKELQDEKGYCPSGERYIYELKQGGKQLSRFWATDCGKPRTYLGSVDATNDLFRAQVPDYDTIDNDYNFF
ncbi:MAG: hypothetical protein QFB86_04300 [Patescibacteria group bacterium]|nr:hypothetical protein [Patescibacteria group bacterium]